MKRMTLFALLLLLLPIASSAQALQPVQIKELAAGLPASRILFTETLTSPAGVLLREEAGTLDLQYPCFRVTKGSLQILSDGTSVWNYDTSAEEVMIFPGDLNALFGQGAVTSDAARETFTISLSDGSRIVYRIISVEAMAESWPEEFFRLDVSALGDDTIVTDLRAK